MARRISMDDQKMISVADASAILRVSERQVRRYCVENKLQCRKDGKAFEIDFKSVVELLKNNPQPEEDTDIDSNINLDETEETDTVISDVLLHKKHVRMEKEDVQLTTRNLSTQTIQILSEKMRSSVQDINEGTEILLKYLNFEHSKNLELQDKLGKLVDELNLMPKRSRLKSKKKWIGFAIVMGLFIISFGMLAWIYGSVIF